VKEEFISQRDKQRKKVIKRVEENIKQNDIPHQDSFKNIIERGYESNIWADEANNCVECGACNTICPTCHCFLLYDQKSENKMARLRIWDSCMIKDFAQVAGGANPRPELWMRLRNRFEKKFDFFPKVADIYACTGCGRCISACPAKEKSLRDWCMMYKIKNPYRPIRAEITEVISETPTIKTIRIVPEEPITFETGQFIELTIPGIGEAPFTPSSRPTMKDIMEITIMNVGKVTEKVHELKNGDIVGVRGPFGKG